jgi:GNAT superfamily N-acetyltransferase
MAAVSQTLIEFVRRLEPVDTPGQTWDVTPERMLRFQPSFPIAGPNLCGEVRTTPARLPGLVEEVRGAFRQRGLPCAWHLDEDSRPAGLFEGMLEIGFQLQSEVVELVLPAGSPTLSADPGIEIRDGLDGFERFRRASEVAGRAFGDPEIVSGLEQRYLESRSRPGSHLLVALVEGEVAGSGWARVTPRGTMLQGGAVAPEFRGRGVYRALVAARQRLAEGQSSPGLATHARVSTSAPILQAFGFQPVGVSRYLIDPELGTASPHRR